MTVDAAYQDDPRWRSAHAEYSRDAGEDESPTQAFVRRTAAIQTMAQIEMEHEAAVGEAS